MGYRPPPPPPTNEGKAAREYGEARGHETMTGETHPRNSYPGTGDRVLAKKTKTTKMAYLEKFGFLVQQEPWPTVGLALERIEATETHTVGYKAARH